MPHGGWTVAAIGLAVGGGLFFAASAATVVILVILARVKPLEEMYRARSQSCSLLIAATHGVANPEQLEAWFALLPNQLRRFVVAVHHESQKDRISVQLVRMSLDQISGIACRLTFIEGVKSVDVASRGTPGSAELS